MAYILSDELPRDGSTRMPSKTQKRVNEAEKSVMADSVL